MAAFKRTRTYGQRAADCANPAGAQLLRIMEEKKSNLSIAVDVVKSSELIRLADLLGPYICMLKTHIDIVEDFTYDVAEELARLAEKHNYVIFEDRKFADIGNTVNLQYSGGVYKIAKWAHITNAHAVPGPGILDGLKVAAAPLQRGVLVLAEMSSKGSLATGEYTAAAIEMSRARRDLVFGFVSGRALAPEEENFVYCSPGVSLATAGDALGQQYSTPDVVIGERGSDVIIVGRGVYEAADPKATAETYRQAGWSAYEKSLDASR